MIAAVSYQEEKPFAADCPLSSIMSPLSQLDGSLSRRHVSPSATTVNNTHMMEKECLHKRNSRSEEDTIATEPLSPPSPLPTPPPSPAPQPKLSYHLRGSSFSRLPSLRRNRSKSLSSSYQGPRPLDKNGNPLKSCLSKTQSKSGARNVSFSHVSIREYSRVVGDNPSVCCGPPLSLGWKYNKRGRIDIDTFQAMKTKAQSSLPNSERQCLRLSPHKREMLLTNIGGANHSQIFKGSIQAQFDNKLRLQSLNALGGEAHYKSIGPRERMLILKESARRKFDRVCKGTTTFQEQQDLWDKAAELSMTKLKRNVTL